MKKKVKSKLHDALIVTLCTAVCVLSIFFFWKDLNRSSVRRDKDSIATIAYKYKIAQRKFNDRVVWERLNQNAPLYNEDIIRTADQSLATITFKDGTQVDIKSQTMIQIFYSENGYTLSIGDGDIDVDTTASEIKKEFSVKLDDGSLVKLDKGSKASASSNVQTGVKSVSLAAGNSSIETVTGQKEVVSAGEAVRLETKKAPAISDKEKSLTVTEIKREPVTVVSVPKELRILAFDENPKSVEIRWKKSASLENIPVFLDVSYDSSFRKIEKSFRCLSEYSKNVDMLPGKTVYWRVYAENNQEAANSGKIFSVKVNPVYINAPSDGADFKYLEEKPKLLFSWIGNEYVRDYTLEISKSRDMKEIIFAKESSNTELNLSFAEEGKYYFRVKPNYSEIEQNGAGSSEIQTFTIKKIEQILPPAAISPSDKAIVMAAKNGIELSFVWKNDAEKTDYELVISDKKDFSGRTFTYKTNKKRFNHFFTAEELPEGQYYWKVCCKNEKGETVESEIRSLKINKFVPDVNRLIYPPDGFASEKDKLASVAFRWKIADEFKLPETKSVLLISTRSDFSADVKSLETGSTELSDIKLKEGKYFWRILLMNENLFEKPVYTETRSFVVLNELKKPEIASPSESQIITVAEENSLTVQWKKVAGADYYKIRIYEVPGAKPVTEVIERGTSAKLIVPFKQNSENNIAYKVTVQAVCEETENSGLRVSPTAERNFSVRKKAPVKLVAPYDKSVFGGLQALHEPVAVSWKQGDKIQKAVFTLKKRQANGTYKIVKQIENPAKTVQLERLESGYYEWTVTASGAAGIDLSAERNFSFMIEEIPMLKKPVLELPAENTVYRADYFRTNRYIDFKWRKVEGATDYEFNLYRKNKDGSLQKIHSQKNIRKTELKFKNLKLLDVGKFEWQVKAFRHGSDGFEEQKGLTEISVFTIDFGLPDKVKTVEPGKMYGD